MPICNQPPPTPASTKTASEIDDNASEAAKMKRTREQAYFNSYEFDASTKEAANGDDDAQLRHQQQPQSQYKQRPPPAPLLLPSLSNSSSTTLEPNQRIVAASASARFQTLRMLPSAHSPNDRRRLAAANDSSTHNRVEPNKQEKEYKREYSYLQQLDAFFSQSRLVSETLSPSIVASVIGKKAALQQAQRADVGSVADVKNDNGNFLLPRAMLKYQSGSSNSMPSATIANTRKTPPLTAPQQPPQTPSQPPQPPPPPPPPPPPEKAATIENTAQRLFASSINDNSSISTGMRPASSSSSSSGGDKNRQHHIPPSSHEPKGTGSSTLTRHKKSSASTTASIARSSASAQNATEVELVLRNGQKSQQPTVTKSSCAANTAAKTGSAPDADATTNGEALECSGSHQSHYSTDKSGSSGYYSSNVCSAYSVEDHIYCEPVIDVLDSGSNSKSKSGPGAHNSNSNSTSSKSIYRNYKTNTENSASSKKSRKLLQGSDSNCNDKSSLTRDLQAASAKLRTRNRSRMKNTNGTSQMERVADAGDGDCDDDDDNDKDDGDDDDEESNAVTLTTRTAVGPLPQHKLKINPLLSTTPTTPDLSENLRILETSIENLDRHLKSFQGIGSQEHITAFMQVHQSFQPHQLPTIMEGYDLSNYDVENSSKPQPRPLWQDGSEFMDDSLLDIDLDSFLLANESTAEKSSSASNKSHRQATDTCIGIDNPTFLHPVTDELEENNYKCAKYINSCPEDAYRVESDIVGCGSSTSQKSNSMEHYVRRYEDQLHFQSTRELLEDVRDKIRLLSRPSENESDHDLVGRREELPQELNIMIMKLKHELETYLARLNHHSELEIRQLYSGLVKNHHIVKMKKAFEHRRDRSGASVLSGLDSDYDFSAYEALRDGVLNPASGVVRGTRVPSIRCASDPNFKMKRKSLAEVFPDAREMYDASVSVGRELVKAKPRVASGSQEPNTFAESSDPLATPRTQLQRNLSFHQPTLNQLDANVGQGPSGLTAGNTVSTNNAIAGSGGSSGSGGESGEKDSSSEWHRKKPSAWELYYGTNRMSQSLLGKRGLTCSNDNQHPLSYPSSRPESDFTLDLPRAEQLRIKMEKEKRFRQRCRYITSFLSLVFFLLIVMVVSLVLTRGKRMFGSMI